VSVRDALAGYATFVTPPEALARLRRGQQDPLGRLDPPGGPGATALLVDAGGAVAGVIEAAPAGWRLVRLLAEG
jgi:hypothetical protein